MVIDVVIPSIENSDVVLFISLVHNAIMRVCCFASVALQSLLRLLQSARHLQQVHWKYPRSFLLH